MVGMPWDQPPKEPDRYRPPAQPPYIPPPSQPYQQPQYQPQPPQQMRPDVPAPSIPVVARNPKTGESVRVDIGQQVQQLVAATVSQALAANASGLQSSANNAIAAVAAGRKPVVELPTPEGQIEDSFSVGPATVRTFFSGMAIDVGFALVATLATVLTPTFNATDKEAWLLTGAMVLKTGLTTAISYILRLKVK